MTHDDDLATALKRAAAGLPVGPAPVDTAVHLGRTLRRRRRAALSTALATAVLVPATALAALSLHASGTDAPTPPAASAPVSSPVRVVAPEQKLAPGRDHTMWLTGRGLFLRAPRSPASPAKPTLAVADVPEGDISCVARTDPTGALHTCVYRGSAEGATFTVTVAGRTLDTRTVTLAGRPGWAAFYAESPGPESQSPPDLVITARAADGTVLASLTKAAAS
ncbi:hypothetical protein [Streptomyces sp. NPDC059783]|uniref:hypothetical protein n=1 Tax=Streptomyces sp. NPDC059783 TaxID=3346944 RepID=UPI00365B4888